MQSLVGLTSMKRVHCWVCFRGGLNQQSHGKGGFYASTDEQESSDPHVAPKTPEDAVWKII